MNEIIFDKQEIEQKVVNTLIEDSSEQEFKLLEPVFNEIINKTPLLINALKDHQKKMNEFQNEMLNTKSVYQEQLEGTPEQQTSAFQDYKKARAKLRQNYLKGASLDEINQTYQLAFQYQILLNRVLGQAVETVFVWVGKKGVPETYILTEPEKFLKIDINRYGQAVMRYNASQKRLSQDLIALEKTFDAQEKRWNSNFDIDKLMGAYKKVKQRFDKYKVRSQGSYILWLNPTSSSKWRGARVYTLGSINEGYADALLNKQFKPVSQAEGDVDLLMQKVVAVTNLSGLLEGDVTVGQTEYAIKSANATTLGLQQILNTAQYIEENIIKSGNGIQELKEYLLSQKQEAKSKEKLLNGAIEEIESVVTEDMEEMIKTLNSTNI